MVDLTISLSELEYFLIMLTRVAAFIFIAPIFSTSGSPMRARAGFAIVLTYLLYVSLGDHPQFRYGTVFGYAALVLRECGVGIIIGFATLIPTTIMQFAGRFIDMESGLAMAQTLDPTTRQNVTISGAWYQTILFLVMLVSGVHRYLIKALADTFVLIPAGSAVYRFEELNNTMLKFLGDYVTIGFRIAMPVFAAMLIVNAILGVLAKVAPQMNMFTIGMQLKIFAAFTIMIIAAMFVPTVSDFIVEEMKDMLKLVIVDLRA